MFNGEVKVDEIKNMEHFLAGMEAAALENEFKNYKTDFVYKDGDFELGYNLAKRQYDLHKAKIYHQCCQDKLHLTL